MRLPLVGLLLIGGALCGSLSAARAHDIPLEAGVAAAAGSDSGLSDRLQRMEERLIQVSARLETLTHTVDTQLAQLDNSVLQLYKEVGSSRLTETVAELREAVLAARAAPTAADSAAASEPGLVSTISQEIRQSEQLLQTQLNDTQQRLVALLEGQQQQRPPAETGTATTVIVERCSFPDQFQRTDEWRPADCAAVQQRHRRSGVYTVFPPVCGNGGGIRVFCDMETDGGGWTVLMRRADVPDHQDFSMGWDSYKWGFGNLSSEFWLGNEYINLLTSMEQMQLRVDLKDWENASAYAKYTPFSVGTEQQKYVLKIGKYEGNAGNSLNYVNGGKFTTKDQDNDTWSKNCAVVYQNPGWQKACMEASLTGPYKKGALKTDWIGLVWKHWKGHKYSLKQLEMKMRPVNYMSWCHKLANEGARE